LTGILRPGASTLKGLEDVSDHVRADAGAIRLEVGDTERLGLAPNRLSDQLGLLAARSADLPRAALHFVILKAWKNGP